MSQPVTVHIYARVEGSDNVERVGDVTVDGTAPESEFLRAFEAAFEAMTRIVGFKENQ